jgi:hypothetical protein
MQTDCVKCKSKDVGVLLYAIINDDENFAPDVRQYACKCHDCGTQWIEERMTSMCGETTVTVHPYEKFV